MKILAFDTSTEACVVGVLVDGEIIDHFSIPEKKHTLILLPIIEDLLQQAGIALSELDAIAYGQGPGAFTGVRLAVSVAQGLGFSADIPVIGISSLASVAHQVFIETKQKNILVAMDARMGEVYFGAFQYNRHGEVSVSVHEQVIPLSKAIIPVSDQWVAVGTGWDAYPEVKTVEHSECVLSSISPAYPHAKAILHLAKQALSDGTLERATQAVPVYVRNNVVNQPWA